MPVFAIAGLDLVALALALLVILLLLAGDKLFSLIANVFSHVPLIGGTIAGAITTYLADTMKSWAASVEKYTFVVGEFFWSLTVSMWHMFYQLTLLQQDAFGWLQNTWLHIEANDFSVLSQAHAYADHAISVALGGVPGIIGDLAQEIDAVPSEIAAAQAATDALAHALADQVSSEAVSLFGQAETALATQIAQAEALAHALADDVQSEAVTLFGQAEGAIGVIQGQIQALPGQIEQTIPGIIDGIVPGLIAGAVPGILAQVLPRVTTLEGEVNQCLEPLCDTVTPQAPKLGQLGQFLNNLELLGIEALIIALAAEAVHDPEAVVHDFTTVVDDVGGPVLSGFRDLIGV